MIQLANFEEREFYVMLGKVVTSVDVTFTFQMTEEQFNATLTPMSSTLRATKFRFTATTYPEGQYIVEFVETGQTEVLATVAGFVAGNPIFATSQYNTYNDDGTSTTYVPSDDQGLVPSVSQKLRMKTLDDATDVSYVRQIKVTNGTLTDDGDGTVTLNTGGAEQLNDLSDVEVTTPANREAIIYDGDNWVNDNVSKSDVGLGNVDNTSDADKPVSTATQTALDLKANTADVPTELNDLSDVSLTTPTGNQALIYNATASAFQALPSYTNRFEDEAEQAASDAVTGTGLFIERYYSAKADGDGIFIDAQSDTPATGKKIVRKIYQIQGGLNDTTVTGWTLLTTFADDTAYSATVSTFDGYRDGDTYGTPPFTLAQTWEEQTAAPAFTGLLNESYGSGAAAAYSVRRLNGNYTGAAIQVERSSDNTTQDIGFDSNGDLDESALTTFCTGTTCKVRTWYDQSVTGGTGSGNDAVQTTHANQPTIYTGGAIVKENGRVAVDFDSGTILNTSLSNSGTFDSFNVISIDGADTRAILLSDIGGSTGSYLLQSHSGSTNTNVSSGAFTVSNYYQNGVSQTFTNRGDAFTKLNGQQNLLVTDGSLTTVGTIGLAYNGIAGYKSQELIFYTSDKSSVRTSIESNVGDYFTQNTPLLDTYTGAAAAYSLRKLRTAYTGSAIRVRRASDNTEQDIGFNVFGELDTVSLAAFCGSSDGFVKTWYSQVGTGVDATQTNTANQPKIYDSSTGVLTENGKPALEFDNSNDSFADVTGLTYNTNDVGAFVVCRATSGHQTYATALNLGPASGNEIAIAYRTERFSYCGTEQGTGSSDLTQNLVSLYADNGSNDVKGYIDQTQKLSTTTVSNSKTSFEIANLRGISSTYWGGTIQEIVFYASSSKADHTNIEDNINTFYSIY